jgi:hypothetical protein
MRYDTFWTISYKGYTINGKHDRLENKEIIEVYGNKFKSLLAAKQAITRHIRKSEPIKFKFLGKYPIQ